MKIIVKCIHKYSINIDNESFLLLVECISSLYTNRLFGDVNIQVASESFTNLHRCILAVRCGRLNEILQEHLYEVSIIIIYMEHE